ncbi:MAG: hypothetical protein U1E65_03785 [Myxococcota bacterium]
MLKSYHAAFAALLILSACDGGGTPTPAGRDATTAAKDATGGTDTGNAGMDGAEPDATENDAGAVDCNATNPAGCEAGRLKGPPPTCMCLTGCENGYHWTGTACEADPMDASQPDAMDTDTGVVDDAGTGMDAMEPADTGVIDDAAVNDTGVAADTGVGPTDTGVTFADGAVDAGSPTDATTNPDATANPDATTVVDSGVADAGRDAGTPRDGGSGPDAGFGIGLNEGDACNPAAANNCLQVPGMICQSLDAPANTQGICLKTCDTANNNVGGTTNPACNGIGANCVDFFGLGAANSFCLASVPAYGELGATVLDICDPAQTNLRIITRGAQHPRGDGPGACFPLCTVTPSGTNPVNLTCSGQFNHCSTDPGDRFQDADGNVFALCGTLVTRGQTCGTGRGLMCPQGGNDICAFGVCRQRFGATCTSTTNCTTSGEACAVAGQGAPGSIAFCSRSCNPLVTGGCPANQACTIANLNGAAAGTCRARTGQVGEGGDCSDVLDFGTNADNCGDGLLCLPVDDGSGNLDFTVAGCFNFCDPNVGTCPTAGTTCGAFNAPFDSFGFCN